MAIIYLVPPLLMESSDLPGNLQSEQPWFSRLGGKNDLPIWPCFECGLPCTNCYQ